jgi:hypothetical protein
MDANHLTLARGKVPKSFFSQSVSGRFSAAFRQALTSQLWRRGEHKRSGRDPFSVGRRNAVQYGFQVEGPLLYATSYKRNTFADGRMCLLNERVTGPLQRLLSRTDPSCLLAYVHLVPVLDAFLRQIDNPNHFHVKIDSG